MVRGDLIHPLENDLDHIGENVVRMVSNLLYTAVDNMFDTARSRLFTNVVYYHSRGCANVEGYISHMTKDAIFPIITFFELVTRNCSCFSTVTQSRLFRVWVLAQ